MTKEEQALVMFDICRRLPQGVIVEKSPLYDNDNKSATPSDKCPQYYKIIGVGGETTLITHSITPELNPKGFFEQKHKRIQIFNNLTKQRVRPFLRPLSDMTEDERGELSKNYVFDICCDNVSIRHHSQGFWDNDTDADFEDYKWLEQWLDSHYFDHRGLIRKGLAVKAPENMYVTKND